MSIPGNATIEATLEFSKKFSKNVFTKLGKTGLLTAQLGFGTYRCHAEIELHKTAIQHALANGINLIDTSSNYTDGMAEVLIGDVLNEAIVWNDKPRESHIIVSKVGYIQGENMEIAQDNEAKGEPFPEVVKYQSDLWHCIHPAFIEDQITRSLARMHLDVLDVYLLHNPEYYLMNAAKNNQDLTQSRKQFYAQIRRAFLHMEKLVDEGLIKWYGVSSNSFPLPEDHAHFVGLSDVWTAYADACLQLGKSTDDGHFAIIQLPFNAVESNALTLINNTYLKKRMSVAELAEKLNLGVLLNRPLNALKDESLWRLSELPKTINDVSKEVENTLQELEYVEDELIGYVAQSNFDLKSEGKTFREFLQISIHLRHLQKSNYDISTYKSLIEHRFGNMLMYGKTLLLSQSNKDEKPHLETLTAKYLNTFRSAANAILLLLDEQNSKKILPIVQKIDAAYPMFSKLPTSQKALLWNTKKLPNACTLVGMRITEYVDDAISIWENK